jgi:hypothetical protein
VALGATRKSIALGKVLECSIEHKSITVLTEPPLKKQEIRKIVSTEETGDNNKSMIFIGEEDAAVGKGHHRMEDAVAVADVEEGAAAGGSEVGATVSSRSTCEARGAAEAGSAHCSSSPTPPSPLGAHRRA